MLLLILFSSTISAALLRNFYFIVWCKSQTLSIAFAYTFLSDDLSSPLRHIFYCSCSCFSLSWLQPLYFSIAIPLFNANLNYFLLLLLMFFFSTIAVALIAISSIVWHKSQTFFYWFCLCFFLERFQLLYFAISISSSNANSKVYFFSFFSFKLLYSKSCDTLFLANVSVLFFLGIRSTLLLHKMPAMKAGSQTLRDQWQAIFLFKGFLRSTTRGRKTQQAFRQIRYVSSHLP